MFKGLFISIAVAGISGLGSLSHNLYAQGPDTLWTRTFGGTDDDVGYSVQQTTDGGFIIAGYTNSFGAGSYDVYLIRTNTQGATLWAKTCGYNTGKKT